MTTTVSINANDWAVDGAIPVGALFIFSLVNPIFDQPSNTVTSTEQWTLKLDVTGAGSTEIPDAVVGNGLSVWSSIRGWVDVAVAGYPTGAIDLVDLINLYSVNPSSLEPTPAPDAWWVALGAITLPTIGTYTYNPDGTIASDPDGATYAYNADGTLHTTTLNGVTRTYLYNPDGTIASVA